MAQELMDHIFCGQGIWQNSFTIDMEHASDSLQDNCRIEHIIEINNTSNREVELEEFENLFPLLTSGKDDKIYCHYRWCREVPEAEERMYMILSGKGLALFSADMTLIVLPLFMTTENSLSAFFSRFLKLNN